MTTFYYKIAPVSKTVFTMLPYTLDTSVTPAVPVVAAGTKAQEVNLATLNEAGLHRALFILKNKVDPAKLGTAEEAWRRLPASNMVTLDPELRKAYPETMLRILLQQFMEIWTLETMEKRNLGEIRKEKFENVQGWPALHSVKPTYVGDSQLVMTQHGVQVQPEECASKLRSLRTKINELATDLAMCGNVPPGNSVCDEVRKLNTQEKESRCVAT